jgi:outer membrane protein assembly factor BamB
VSGADAQGNWPQWRGPYFNGSSDAKNLPDKFGPDQNLVWSLELPGPGAGTPIVWGDRVFVSAVDKRNSKLTAICAGKTDGKVQWMHPIGEGSRATERNNMAAPSPLTDGKHVWFYFGTGDLACFDMAGKQVWHRNLVKDHGSFNVMHIYGSSPLLHGGKLYVQNIQRDKPYGDGMEGTSYLLAIDPVTGKGLWKQDRPDDAVDETKEAYSTPTPIEVDGKTQIVLIGGDVVTAHDPDTGAEIWRCGGWNPEKIGHWRLVPSVVSAGGLVIACPPKGGKLFAIKPGKGDVTRTGVAWRSEEFSSDVAVPLVYKGDLFVLDDGKRLARLDPATGKKKWAGELGGGPPFRASPTGADGKIYCMNEGGEVWCVSAEEFKILHQVELGGDSQSRGSISLVDGRAFVRTGDTLYCFGKK